MIAPGDDNEKAKDPAEDLPEPGADLSEMDDTDVFRWTRDRESDVQKLPLGPGSLVGSWFLKLEDGDLKWQGSVVAEPQAGVYLLEVHSWIDGGSEFQRLVTGEAMQGRATEFSHDAEVEWLFFDNARWMRAAIKEHLRDQASA